MECYINLPASKKGHISINFIKKEKHLIYMQAFLLSPF